MCGIVGYVGPRAAHAAAHRGAEAPRVPRLRLGRHRDDERQRARDAEGDGQDLAARERVVNGSPMHGTLGIAHTRWATHGAPNECNAHPHIDCTGTIAVVHNGIIENYGALRQMLEEQGHTFESETDTEVLAHLIEAAFDGNLEEAVIEALR